jgi:hypothetical protein
MKISILGFGWFGAPLGVELKNAGHSVRGSTTRPDKKLFLEAQGLSVDLMKFPELPSQTLLDAEILILNIPPFAGELDWFKSFKIDPKTWVIFISSTSGNLADQEDWVMGTFPRHTILRFGGLLGGSRHPGKFLSGKKDLKSPLSPVNLIHLDDTIGLTKKIIEENKVGFFYGVCDEHSTREEFYQDYCQRTGLALPEFDQNDKTVGKTVLNDEVKKFYAFKFPRLLGRDL